MRFRQTIGLLSLSLLAVLLTSRVSAAPDQELKYRGRTVAEWAGRLKNQSAQVRRRAAEALGEIGAGAKTAAPALVEVLRDRDMAVSQSAWIALVKLEAAAVLTLLEMLKDRDPVRRAQAAELLEKIGPQAKDAVPGLAEAMKDGDAAVRRCAAKALDVIGATVTTIPTLIEALKDKEESVRDHASNSLTRLGADAVPALLAALKEKDPSLRCQVLSVLGSIGESAKAAVPVLLGSLKDSNEQIRGFAASALDSVGRSDVPALLGVLKDKDAYTRTVVVRVLGFSTPPAKAKEAVPELGRILTEDESADLRRETAVTLGRIGAEAKAAVADLIEALRDNDVLVRSNAADALGSIGTAARDAVPALIEAYQKDSDIQGSASRALKMIDPEAAKKAGVP